MDIDRIMADLNRERDRLNRAIAALEGTPRRRGRRRGLGSRSTMPRKRRGGLTAAGRKRLSELMKKRWAERRRKGQKAL